MTHEEFRQIFSTMDEKLEGSIEMFLLARSKSGTAVCMPSYGIPTIKTMEEVSEKISTFIIECLYSLEGDDMWKTEILKSSLISVVGSMLVSDEATRERFMNTLDEVIKSKSKGGKK